MSQWLDAVATASTNSGVQVDTSGVGLWYNKAATPPPIIVDNTNNKTMLYLTAAGVLLAALTLFKNGR